jgi:4-diphosphocytidyl-2-C-methyl-D-erythritol kinase
VTETIRAFAPAKVNLALHVCGQRPDGYHLLDSLVVFAGISGIRCLPPPQMT